MQKSTKKREKQTKNIQKSVMVYSVYFVCVFFFSFLKATVRTCLSHGDVLFRVHVFIFTLLYLCSWTNKWWWWVRRNSHQEVADSIRGRSTVNDSGQLVHTRVPCH